MKYPSIPQYFPHLQSRGCLPVWSLVTRLQPQGYSILIITPPPHHTQSSGPERRKKLGDGISAPSGSTGTAVRTKEQIRFLSWVLNVEFNKIKSIVQIYKVGIYLFKPTGHLTKTGRYDCFLLKLKFVGSRRVIDNKIVSRQVPTSNYLYYVLNL